MEFNGSNSHSHDTQPSEGSKVSDTEKNPSENYASNPLFVNHAEIAWHERRKAWVGEKPREPIQRFADPRTIWKTAYGDVATHELFTVRIPLADVVDFLYDIWLDEGLYS